jgi:hypothetical protein
MWFLLIAAYGVMLQPLAMPSLEACKAKAMHMVTHPDIGGAMPPGSLRVQCVQVAKDVEA